MSGHRDLRRVSWAAGLCALAALLLPWEAVRLVFAAPLALFLPGYALTAAVFAVRPPAWPQFLLLSLALSLGVLVLGTLLLNYLPGGLRAPNWGVLLLLVVLAAARSAALRRPPLLAGPTWPQATVSRGEGALLLSGLGAAAAALVLAGTLLPAEDIRGYTQLWLLPERGEGGAVVRVGVSSQQTDTVSYRLKTRIGGRQEVERTFSLAPGETRVVTIEAETPPPPGRAERAVATLFLEDRPDTVYRRASGWVSSPQTDR